MFWHEALADKSLPTPFCEDPQEKFLSGLSAKKSHVSLEVLGLPEGHCEPFSSICFTPYFQESEGFSGLLKELGGCFEVGSESKGSETQSPAFTLNSSAFICFLHLHYILFEEGTQWPTEMFGNH